MVESKVNNTIDILEQDSSEVGLLCLRKDNIITFEPLPNKETHTLAAMKYELGVFINWAGDNKLGFLTDNRELKKFESEVRLYAQEHLPLFCDKFALIVKPGISAFLTKMFIHINRPTIPTKTFTTPEEAIIWLKEV